MSILSIREKDGLDGLTYAICGDLKYGRAAHSFLEALAKFSVKKIILASPQELRMPAEYLAKLKDSNIEIEECYDLDYAVANARGDLYDPGTKGALCFYG